MRSESLTLLRRVRPRCGRARTRRPHGSAPRWVPAGSEGALNQIDRLAVAPKPEIESAGRSEAPVLPVSDQLAYDTRDPCAIPLASSSGAGSAHHIARVLDFQCISAALTPAFEGYHANQSCSTDRSPAQRGVVDTVVGTVDLMNRVQACVGERELMREYLGGALSSCLRRLPPLACNYWIRLF